MYAGKNSIRFGSVEIPKALYDAYMAGKLVIFAGAGASAAKPSSLPLFGGLSQMIAHGTNYVKNDKESLDQFLGKMENSGVKVREITRKILTNPESSPSRLHKGVVSLYRSAKAVRIVTTNFDSHFTTAFHNIFGEAPEEYYAPALPLGHDFSGIVYLHGLIHNDLKRIVITDKDFGQAYITQGWATRFLQEMFNTYTVLFVGYSHDDPVMNYLTRGLPEGYSGRRFILTSRDENDHWRLLGVEPIVYTQRPDQEDKHVAGVEAIESWVSHTKLEFIDHERFITDIVSRPPPVDEEILDRVRFVLNDSELIKIFVNTANSVEWLKWLSDNGYLNSVFSQEAGSPRDEALAWWLANKCFCQHTNIILNLLRDNKSFISKVLWTRIAGVLCNKRGDISSQKFHILIQILLKSLPSQFDNQWFEQILRTCKISEDDYAASRIFIHCTTPQALLETGWDYDSLLDEPRRKIEIGIGFPAQHYWIQEIWRKYFLPRIGEFSKILFESLVGNLRQAYILLLGSGRDLSIFDPISRNIPAVEQHHQNRYSQEVLQDLVSAIRDIIDHYSNSCNYTYSYIQSWKTDSCAMFRRFAVHATRITKFIDDSAKIVWLSEYQIADNDSHHEIFVTIQDCYAGSAANARQQLVDSITRWNPTSKIETSSEYVYYAQCRMLDWMLRSDPNCKIAQTALEIAKKNFPEFHAPRHPELTSWIESGLGREEATPYTADQLLDLDLDQSIDELIAWRPEHAVPFHRTRLLAEIEKACEKNPAWRSHMLQLIKERNKPDVDLWSPILSSLSNHKLKADEWDVILTLASILKVDEANARYFINFLLSKIRKDGGIPNDLLCQAFKAAEEIWDSSQVQEDIPHTQEESDWYTACINHLGGKIAELWLHTLSRYVNQSSDAGQLPPPPFMLDRFKILIESSDTKSKMGFVMLASNLTFLGAVAREWTFEHLVPTFKWTGNVDTATRAWQGYIVNRRLTEELLPVMTPHIFETYNHIQHLGRWKEMFCQLVAGLCMWSDNPYSVLQEFIEKAQPNERAWFAKQIAVELQDKSEAEQKKQWDQWLEQYWQYRILGKPKPLQKEELSEMLEWSLTSPYSLKTSVDLIHRSGDLGNQAHFLFSITESPLLSTHGADLTKILAHIAPQTTAPYDLKQIEEIVDKIVESASPNEDSTKVLLRRICTLLIEKQHHSAQNILRKLED